MTVIPRVAVGLYAVAGLDKHPVGVVASAQSPLICPLLKLHLECFFVGQFVVLVDRSQVYTWTVKSVVIPSQCQLLPAPLNYTFISVTSAAIVIVVIADLSGRLSVFLSVAL